MREDAMTEERLALAELLEKAGEGDFLRAVAEAGLQLLMEAGVGGWVRGGGGMGGGGRGGRGANGLRGAPPRSRAGVAATGDPKAAQGQFFPAISRSPQEFGEGAGRGHPGSLDRGGVDPPCRRSG